MVWVELGWVASLLCCVLFLYFELCSFNVITSVWQNLAMQCGEARQYENEGNVARNTAMAIDMAIGNEDFVKYVCLLPCLPDKGTSISFCIVCMLFCLPVAICTLSNLSMESI